MAQKHKSEPTLRQLLERDAKNPLPEIGLGDDFKKSQMQNAVDDVGQQKIGQDAEWRKYQHKLSFVEKRDEHKVPKPKTSTAEIVVNAFVGAKPAGERSDTEKARVKDWNARTNTGRNKPVEVYGMTALNGNPEQKFRKLMGIK